MSCLVCSWPKGGPFVVLEKMIRDALSMDDKELVLSRRDVTAFYQASCTLARASVAEGAPVKASASQLPVQPLLRYLRMHDFGTAIPETELEELKALRTQISNVIRSQTETHQRQGDKKEKEPSPSESGKVNYRLHTQVRAFVQAHPEPVISIEKLAALDNMFVLDNSLRETTVGTIRGHTLKEKEEILNVIAETGLEEMIIGVFGNRETVDTHIPRQWIKRGIPFDNAWGFVNAYDLHPVDMDGFLRDVRSTQDRTFSKPWRPSFKPKTEYSAGDVTFLEGLGVSDFGERKAKYESPRGRLPRGLFEMARFGIPSVVLEIDCAVAGFDYEAYNIVEHVTRLLEFVRDSFARRKLPNGETSPPRVLINLRDFSAYCVNAVGCCRALELVDALCRLDPNLRPFGFIVEEPTAMLFPDQLARLVRAARLVMNRAGHLDARFLVHVHRGFELAEACVLASLSNGADGVWAAVCRTGANVGHASSTVTLVNLHRAGNPTITKKYNLAKLAEAARRVTEITMRKPCSPHEETYGTEGFDIPFLMATMDWCRLHLADIAGVLGMKRKIRINEFSTPDLMFAAMKERFGEPEEGDWDPSACEGMSALLMKHLVSGSSFEYNSTGGLAVLYHSVGKKPVSRKMAQRVCESSDIPSSHPLVTELRTRMLELAQAVKQHPEWYSVDLFNEYREDIAKTAPAILYRNARRQSPSMDLLLDLDIPLHVLVLEEIRAFEPETQRILLTPEAVSVARKQTSDAGSIPRMLLVALRWQLAQYGDGIQSVEDGLFRIVMEMAFNAKKMASDRKNQGVRTAEPREEMKLLLNRLSACRAVADLPPGFDSPFHRQKARLMSIVSGNYKEPTSNGVPPPGTDDRSRNGLS